MVLEKKSGYNSSGSPIALVSGSPHCQGCTVHQKGKNFEILYLGQSRNSGLLQPQYHEIGKGMVKVYLVQLFAALSSLSVYLQLHQPAGLDYPVHTSSHLVIPGIQVAKLEYGLLNISVA